MDSAVKVAIVSGVFLTIPAILGLFAARWADREKRRADLEASRSAALLKEKELLDVRYQRLLDQQQDELARQTAELARRDQVIDRLRDRLDRQGKGGRP